MRGLKQDCMKKTFIQILYHNSERKQMSNYFEELNAINVNDKTEQKGNLTYLSWAWAWGELKKKHPDAFYTIYENDKGWFYHTDGKTAWVKTGVTVGGLEHIEYLPVMDYKNNSIAAEKITSTAVNKTIQRSLTKAVARHGLGLYIYAGEDLPEEPAGAYPPREEMLKDIRIKYPDGSDNLKQLLDYLKVSKLEKATDAQIKAVYAKVK